MAKRKNSAAVALGRKGGKKKVPKGLATMSPEKALEVRKAGAKARWDKYREEQRNEAHNSVDNKKVPR